MIKHYVNGVDSLHLILNGWTDLPCSMASHRWPMAIGQSDGNIHLKMKRWAISFFVKWIVSTPVAQPSCNTLLKSLCCYQLGGLPILSSCTSLAIPITPLDCCINERYTQTHPLRFSTCVQGPVQEEASW